MPPALARWRMFIQPDAKAITGSGKRSAQGVPVAEGARTVALARRSHRLALQLAHYEEVRGLLSTWRWLHRWLALLLLLLTVVHVVVAVRYGAVDFSWF